MKKTLKKILKNIAGKLSQEDVGKTVANEGAILKIAGKMKGLYEDVKTLIAMLKDYKNGKYRELPWAMIASVTAALIYVVFPVDLIPDLTPIIGLSDDAVVVALVLSAFALEIESYRKWRHNHISRETIDI